ncbi:MAG TPA: hypothetical protein VNQ73_16470 [Ilumatobacter sp.]|nr:hypothetical protein [Ilumatobacter sp.]
MATPRILALESQLTELRSEMDAIDTAAAARGGDLTEAEQASYGDLVNRAAALNESIKTATTARMSVLEAGSLLGQLNGTVHRSAPAGESPELTAGEYFAAVAELLNGGDEAKFVNRAARYIDRATGVTADVAGILPEPIVGPLLDLFDARRRVWSSFTPRTMPGAGKTFERPFVAQHVEVGEQLTEATALASQKFEVDSATVTKRTIGGTLEVSRQMQDWSTPEALGLVVADFVKVYARFTEAAAVEHLLDLASADESYDDSTTAAVVDSFVQGCLAVCEAIDNDVPLTIWLSTDAAAELTVPTGATDRTRWAVVKEALEALDSSVSWVTSRRLPAGTRIIGAGELVEGYEQRHGLLSMVKPTNLTTDVAYSGYIAFHGVEDGFVNLSDPVGS